MKPVNRAILGYRALVSLLLTLSVQTNAFAQCSGNQATNEQTPSGQNLYVAKGQAFQVNVSAVSSSLTSSQLNDLEAGIQSWAGTSGISISFTSAAPGPGVVTVVNDTSIPSSGHGTANAGGTGYAPNQITGGTISLNLGYTFACSTGTCPAYSASAPNADNYLTGLGAHEMGHVLGLSEPTDAADPCTQTSTSVMGGQCGTNNNGDGMSPAAPTSTKPTSCDTQNVTAQTTASTGTGKGGGGGGGSGGGGDGGGGGYCYYYSYDEWDDGTNTLTDYSGAIC